jgi:hypothetical protein
VAAPGARDGKRRLLTAQHLTALRVDGGIAYESMAEMDEDELLWEAEQLRLYFEAQAERVRREAKR